MLSREIMAVCSEIHTKHTTALFGQNVDFLGAVANFQTATVSFVMSVRLPACNKSASISRIFMIFYI